MYNKQEMEHAIFYIVFLNRTKNVGVVSAAAAVLKAKRSLNIQKYMHAIKLSILVILFITIAFSTQLATIII